MFWCEHAWLSGDEVADGVVLTVADGLITGIDVDVMTPPSGVVRLPGLTLPGFANAHSHMFHRALRGRVQTGGGTFWSWRDRMYELAARLDPDTFEALATATFAEMVLAGYTVVGEFHYLHHGPDGVPYVDRNEMGRRLVVAAERAGIRMTLLDTCYLHGGISGGGIGAPLSAVQLRFSDGSVDQWIDRVGELAATPTCRVGAAIHSVRAVDPDSARTVATWAAAGDAPLHAHVAEQPQENADCRAVYGRTPVGVLDDAGVLSDRFTAVHATHVVTDDIALLAQRRSRCCICATTERDLADGIGPTPALADAGIDLCIGSDSHAVIDPFEETRAIELNARLATQRRGNHRPVDLLGAATASGYASLGWAGGGRLALDAPADFVSVALDSPRLAGTDRADPLASLLFAAAPADVGHVVVAGERVVADGRHLRVDVVTELERSISDLWAAT